jgi:hypothetical protein
MIINFEHRPAAHCETGVTSNMLNFYGQPLSESMIFGIGEGLTFVYIPFVSFKGNSMKFSFRSFPGAIFTCAMKKLNVRVGMKKRFSNQEDAMKEMDKLLSAGIPVGNVVGLFHLPYSPIRTHFNAHNICVVGKEGDEYVVSDPNWHTTLLRISYSDLVKVRFSEGAFKPRGKMYWIKEKPVLADIRPIIARSIKNTCRRMVGTPMSFLGAKGIVTLSKQIRKLVVNYGERDAIQYLASLVQAIEEIGTGGAGYRYMYGIFLHEAGEMLNESKLKDYSVEMTQIGDLWRQFALECGRKFKNRSEASYDDLADKLVEIAAAEKKFFVALKKEKL